jgi:DNA polymerase V
MFALVDCNNFYASCERVFRPDLIGKPIVVLSNNDGCVIARSNEAKAVGIPMGAPAFKYDEIFKQNNINVFSANFSLYGDMSKRVMSTLSFYSPDIEIYSIDEAFLNLKGFEDFDLQEYATQINYKVNKGTGIPISVGIAPTKALSKVANRIAKKYAGQTKNVYVIDTEEKRIKALKWLKVEDIWGIGRQHSKQLKAINVNTAYDFISLDDQWVKNHLAIVGLRLKYDLQGIPTLGLEESQPKLNIATTRSFETDYTDLTQLKERIATFTVVCAEKLRKQHSYCHSLTVFIRSNKHKTDSAQYNQSITVKLPFSTNSSIELVKFANLALQTIFRKGYRYKKAGVIVHELSPENVQQISLFENMNEKHIPLMQVMDKLNKTYGQQKIRLAAQDLNRVWKMKQEKLSPCYTTKLIDIITLNC